MAYFRLPDDNAARNAPSATDTPNKAADPVAIANAKLSMASVKSSRDRVRATKLSNLGTALLPTITTSKPNMTNLAMAQTNATRRPLLFPGIVPKYWPYQAGSLRQRP